MLKNDIEKDSLFELLKPQADALNMVLIDVQKHVHGPKDIQVCITVDNKEFNATVKELEVFHRTVEPSLELVIGREELSMEVSTPGLQRNLRDFYEFTVFTGRTCRVYCTSFSSWVEGVIDSTYDGKLVLGSFVVVDTNETGERIELDFADIQKAKLEYKFDNKKSGDK